MIKGRGHFSPLRQNCRSSSWISTKTFLTPLVSLDDGSLTLGVSRMDGLTQRPSPLWYRVSVSLEIHSSESGAWNLNDFCKTPVDSQRLNLMFSRMPFRRLIKMTAKSSWKFGDFRIREPREQVSALPWTCWLTVNTWILLQRSCFHKMVLSWNSSIIWIQEGNGVERACLSLDCSNKIPQAETGWGGRWGRDTRRRGVCIPAVDSCWRMAETNTIL